jgi:hypothetical protein
MTDVTRILPAIEHGDSAAAASELLPLVYDVLRRLAAAKMAYEKPGQAVRATALVHEAYIRLVDGSSSQHWDRRGHFLPQPPRRCDGSWSTTHGENVAQDTVGTGNELDLTRRCS